MGKDKPEGLLIGAGTLIGIGVGMLMGQIAPGVLIGIGVGLAAAFAYKAMKK